MKTISLFLFLTFVVLFFSASIGQAQYIKHDVSKLQTGMNTEEVRNLFGRPLEINRHGDAQSETQQWVYQEGRSQYLFIYFKDGIYTDWSRYGERRRSF